MPIYSINYSPLALQDLIDIYTYISNNLQAPDAAKKQIKNIQSSITTLNFFPQRFQMVEWEPWKSKNIHRLPVNKYIIFYRIDDQNHTVLIVRVMYSGQNIKDTINSLH